MTRTRSEVPHALIRPQPPAAVLETWSGLVVPAPEVWAWAIATFLDEGAPLYNPEHAHLRQAWVGVCWTNVANTRHMRHVIGTAETPQTQGGAWKRARAEQQLREWFQFEPDFLITLYAPAMAEADDATFCSVVEHELLHCAQVKDEWGAPRFNKQTGRPIFGIRGHDVEEFTSIIERYGPRDFETRRFLAAGQRAPAIAGASVAAACGTCLARTG